MNVDTQFPPAPITPLAGRPTQARSDQDSARPVDRPHHVEPANNHRQQKAGHAPNSEEQRRAADQPPAARPESELSAEQKRELEQLRSRDRAVRAHEAAHQAAAGHLTRGGARFEFETGADGRRYAVGGEVSIDTSEVAGDPQATVDKAQTIRRAANAPAQPSSQDLAVAAEASRMEAEARRELRAQEQDTEGAGTQSSTVRQSGDRLNNTTEPAAVGELLDVLV